MDWLKMQKGTPEKPEIMAMADALGVPDGVVFLACFRVWRWADSNTTDGNVSRVTKERIDVIAHLPGFANALLEVGWLQARNGSLQFPNFDRHMGQSGKRRTLTAMRVAEHRRRKSGEHVTQETLPEKRREEKNRDPPLPPLLDTAEFKAAWARWKQHRSEIRKPLKPSGEATLLKQLAAFGPAWAVERIDQAIANGWTGLIFDEDRERLKNGTLGGSAKAGKGTFQFQEPE